ncbi:MAG: hypothetical protein ACR2NU_15035, partial [Aeoliella sp.]
CAKPCVRLQDEIVEVNTRRACCTTDPARLAAAIEVKELIPDGHCGARRWVESDISRLALPAGPGTVTVVYVHGNKINHCETRRRSMDVYHALVARACDERPIRFVIWSWPADEMKGFLRDFRVKATRTRPIGWQLAWGLNQFPPESPVSILGYSYGARIIGGTAHLLAGGDLSGLALPNPVPRPPMRVAFIAAATHAEWFGPGRYHGLAMTQIDRLFLVNNQSDPAMRFYKYTSKNCSPQALGLKGPTCIAPADRCRVRYIDATDCIGRTHDLYKYTAKRHIMTHVWRHLTYADGL